LRHGDLPGSFEAARLDLVARREDGNREFARLLEICLTHTVEVVEEALLLARKQGGWSADSVRQVLNSSLAPPTTPPLDPIQYPAYQATSAKPDLSAYDRLLEVPS
jgi:hypothetical protein